MKNPKRDLLRIKIAEGLVGIQREIKKYNVGEEAIDDISRLQFIENKLLEMDQILADEKWSSIPKKKSGISRIVVDGWPLQDPLGDLLADIEYEYTRLK